MAEFVLVAGSRNFTDADRLAKILAENVKQDDTIVEGGAKGVDTMAREWAEAHGVAFVEIPADWKKYGKAAGPLRNIKMCEFVRENGGEAIYFWDGKSKGTGDCIKTAKKLGLPVTIWNYAAEEMIRYNQPEN